MEKLKLNIDRYKTKDTKLCKSLWQETANNAVKDFKIKYPQDQRIFALAKKNLQYLMAQIETINEKMARENQQIKEHNAWTKYKSKPLKEKHDYTGLLIYLLKKQ